MTRQTTVCETRSSPTRLQLFALLLVAALPGLHLTRLTAIRHQPALRTFVQPCACRFRLGHLLPANGNALRARHVDCFGLLALRTRDDSQNSTVGALPSALSAYPRIRRLCPSCKSPPGIVFYLMCQFKSCSSLFRLVTSLRRAQQGHNPARQSQRWERSCPAPPGGMAHHLSRMAPHIVSPTPIRPHSPASSPSRCAYPPEPRPCLRSLRAWH